MKKIFSLLLIACVACSFMSCNKKGSAKSTPLTDSVSEAMGNLYGSGMAALSRCGRWTQNFESAFHAYVAKQLQRKGVGEFYAFHPHPRFFPRLSVVGHESAAQIREHSLADGAQWHQPCCVCGRHRVGLPPRPRCRHSLCVYELRLWHLR